MRTSLVFAVTLSLLSPAATALADAALPAGTAGGGAVTKGSTDITTEGKVETAQKPSADAKDATEWSIQGGGMLATGNSKAMSETVGTTFRLRRGANQLSFLGAANYAGATPIGGTYATTADNQQAKARYDRFISGELVAFLGAQLRRDSLAGLVPRSQLDPGVGYYFIDTKDTTMWTEAGYDFLYDRRADNAIAAADALDPTAAPLAKTAASHSARLFYGLQSALNSGTTINLALEFLQAFNKSTATNNYPVRFNGDLIVNAKLTSTFSVAASYSLKFDSGALPGKQQLDTITALSLVYTIL